MPSSEPRIPSGSEPLAESLAALAGTPDDTPEVDRLLHRIVQLTADRVGAADYASVTALRDDALTTVAASSELARAVDAVQYSEHSGPCVEALETQSAVAAPDVTATMHWPGFSEAATRLGLAASVSVPLFVASGAPVSVMNLYGRDHIAMAPLIAGVWAIYHPSRRVPLPARAFPPVDAGGRELLNGLAQAVNIRRVIQHAIQIVMARDGCTAREAYLHLLGDAAMTGKALLQTAGDLVAATG